MGLHGVSKKLACPVNRSRRAGMQGIEQQKWLSNAMATCGEAINMRGPCDGRRRGAGSGG